MLNKRIGIRWQLLTIMLPISIIPIILIVIFSTTTMFSHLEDKNKDFYSSIMQMLAYNIDSTYQEYGRILSNAVQIPNVEQGLASPPFKSAQEELEISTQITGKNVIVNGKRVISEGLRKTFEEKIEGDLLVYELDKYSLVDKTNYKVHSLQQSTPLFNLDLLFQSDMFKKLRSNNNIRLIFGILDDKVTRNVSGEPKATIIYPYYREPPENETDTFSKFIVVCFHQDFIKKFFADIEHIKQGTLYIIDQFDNIVTTNHPDFTDDYYDYDEEKGQYVLGDNPANDPFEPMSFKDYRLLNTDKNILNIAEVQKVVSKLNSSAYYNDENYEEINNKKTIHYKGVDYLMTTQFCPSSEFKLVYFHPLYHVRKPVYFVIRLIIYLTIAMIIIVIVISTIFSKVFIGPIQNLAGSAVQIARGEYDNKLDISKFSGEFFELGASFNEMARQIKEYNLHLEDIVSRRTRELEQANKKMLNELAVARKIQQAIIPKKFPKVDELDFYGFYKPMDALGGDFYDVYKVDDENVAFLILDVCGHGVAAALITAMAKVLFVNNTKPNLTTSEIVSLVNKEMCSVIGENNTYFTAFLSIYNIKTHIMQYSNAGHCEIIILKQDGQTTLLPCNSIFVGMMANVTYKVDTAKLDAGDRLVMYTDGIPETRNSEKVMFGLEALRQALLKYSSLPQQELVENLVSDLDEYRYESAVGDDVTILLIDFKE